MRRPFFKSGASYLGRSKMFDTSKTLVIDNYTLVPKFQTKGSFSFAVVRNTDQLDIRNPKGWVDFHEVQHPCRSVAIRGSLPSECLEFDFLKRLVAAICLQFQISETMARDVVFFRATDCIDMSRAGDAADGTTDRISITRSFLLPRD